MCRKVSILALTLFTAACAPVWPYGVEPSPVAGAPLLPVIRVQLPLDQVNSACHRLAKDTTRDSVDGCALAGAFACVIVWPELEPAHGYGQGHLDAIYAHELGHCHGLVHPADGRGWMAAPSSAKAGG